MIIESLALEQCARDGADPRRPPPSLPPAPSHSLPPSPRL
jgi:hypothetical protein